MKKLVITAALIVGILGTLILIGTISDTPTQPEHQPITSGEVQFQKEYQEQRAKELADPKSYPVPVEQPIVHEPDVQADETSEMQKKFEFLRQHPSFIIDHPTPRDCEYATAPL